MVGQEVEGDILGAPININLGVSIILATTTLGDPAFVELPAPIPSTLGIGASSTSSGA